MSQVILNSQATVGVTSSIVSPLSATFRYGLFTNDSANTIYLSIGTPAVVGSGIRLNANGGTYEINNLNPIRGDIHAISAVAGSNLSYVAITNTQY